MKIRGFRELDYLKKLLYELEGGNRIARGIKKAVGKHPTGEKYTQSELVDFLCGEKSNSYANETIRKCIDQEILVEVDRKALSHKTIAQYQLDRNKLRNQIRESNKYDIFGQIGFDLVNREG